MKDLFLVLIGTFFIFIIAYFLYFDAKEEAPEQNEIRVRCPPKHYAIVPDAEIRNNGYVNELMYKPVTEGSVNFQNILLETQPSLPLNGNGCKLSKDLPIGNINVEYLLQNKTSYI